MPRSKKGKIHPVLDRRINVVLAAMSAAGMPMVITDDVRTQEEQEMLYKVGRRGKPGEKIVTNADGVLHKSNHQAKDDGFGYAVDCAFLVDSKITWDVPRSWWDAYGALCVACGLIWGGNFKSLVDRPHAELPIRQ